MEIIILAGGLGTRLRSTIGNEIPKCMAIVAGKPFLWYLLKYLTKYDVTKVILSVGYLRNVIFEWIDKVKDEFPFEFDYAIEEKPLGTGGGIRLALNCCSDTNVLVLNGDTFFDVDLQYLMDKHICMGGELTMALKLMKEFERYGSVEYSDDGHVTAFYEKAYCEKGLINGGIYAINRIKLDMAKMPEKFSFETAILGKQCEMGMLYGITSNGYFKDIGVPEDYAQANEDFKEMF